MTITTLGNRVSLPAFVREFRQPGSTEGNAAGGYRAKSTGYPLHPRINRISITVPMIDTTMEPMQPSWLE